MQTSRTAYPSHFSHRCRNWGPGFSGLCLFLNVAVSPQTAVSPSNDAWQTASEIEGINLCERVCVMPCRPWNVHLPSVLMCLLFVQETKATVPPKDELIWDFLPAESLLSKCRVSVVIEHPLLHYGSFVHWSLRTYVAYVFPINTLSDSL